MVNGRTLIVGAVLLDALLEVGKAISIAACFLACSVDSYSQPETFTINARQNPAGALPISFRCLNVDYQDGYLTDPRGEKTKSAKFNYDLYLSLLTFINEMGDTLLIKEPAAVTYVHIGNEDFYHHVKSGLYKILAADTFGFLTANAQLIKRLPKPTNEGYGTTTNGTTSTVSRSLDVTYERITKYYLIERSGAISPATKQGFYRTFRNQEDILKAHINKEKVNFNNEEDLVRLFRYAISLGSQNVK